MRSPPISVVLALLLAGIAGTWAIDAQCSACAAVAAELQRRLDAEKPRNHLDLRHRLDKHGKRYGKVIAYKLSELRAVELLEDLCDHLGEDYSLLRLDSPKGGEAKKFTGWIKVKGKDSHIEDLKVTRQPRDMEIHHARTLVTFCGALVDKHEEEIVEALKGDDFGTEEGVAPVLCEKIAKRCKPDELLSIEQTLEDIKERQGQPPTPSGASEEAAEASSGEAAVEGKNTVAAGGAGETQEAGNDGEQGGIGSGESEAVGAAAEEGNAEL